MRRIAVLGVGIAVVLSWGCKRDMDKRCKEVTEQVFGMLAQEASRSAAKVCATTGPESIDCMLAADDMSAFDACTRTASIALSPDGRPDVDPRCAEVEARAAKITLAGLELQRKPTFAACKKGGEPVAKCLKHAPSLKDLQACLASAAN